MSQVKYCISVKDVNEPTRLYVISRFIVDAGFRVVEEDPFVDNSAAFGSQLLYKLEAAAGEPAKDIMMGSLVPVIPNWTDPTFPAYHRMETMLKNTDGTENSRKGMDTKNSPTL